jgi:hypothetical protein
MVQLFPAVRQPSGVAAACLLTDAEWVRHLERLHGWFGEEGAEVRTEDDGGLRLRQGSEELRVGAWPRIELSQKSTGPAAVDAEPEDATWADGCLLPQEMSAVFAATLE